MVLGREGPTIQMGGALGRMVADKLRLSTEHAHVLLAAGSGAGLTAAFNAPLAGMLFVIEEMRPQFHYNVISVQAVLVACAVSDLAVRLVLGDALVIPMLSFATPPVSALWIFPIFGALVGLVGFVFNHALIRMVDRTARLGERARIGLAAVVGGLVGWLALELPEAVGGGEAEVSFRVDPAILGGIIVRVGEHEVDGSARRTLETLQQSLV